WDSPYRITKAYPKMFSYMLNLFTASNIYPTLYISCLKKFIENDDILFPSHYLEEPGLTLMPKEI
ncbi:hypothetical protein AN958_07237, partial [Leucoagaricus sp. SymC.cos]